MTPKLGARDGTADDEADDNWTCADLRGGGESGKTGVATIVDRTKKTEGPTGKPAGWDLGAAQRLAGVIGLERSGLDRAQHR